MSKQELSSPPLDANPPRSATPAAERMRQYRRPWPTERFHIERSDLAAAINSVAFSIAPDTHRYSVTHRGDYEGAGRCTL